MTSWLLPDCNKLKLLTSGTNRGTCVLLEGLPTNSRQAPRVHHPTEGMPELISVLTKGEIKKRVVQLSRIISSGYQNDELILIDYIKSLNPKTVKVCTLLSKHERREARIHIDYACHEVQNGYLVGYGLDYAGDYRHLPQIYELIL